MTGFNYDSAREARARNPRLTEFDTGEVLQPVLDPRPDERGFVDFDNDESSTVLRLRARPSGTEADTTVLELTAFEGRVAIECDGHPVFSGRLLDTSGDDHEIRVNVPSCEWDESESTYVDIEGITAIFSAWTRLDVRRSWVQVGEGSDALIALSWWDGKERAQKVDVLDFDQDAENAIGFGWSLTGLPFSVALEPATASLPVIVADLDGTVDAAAWIQPGYVLDRHDTEYLRGLVLPSAYERDKKD